MILPDGTHDVPAGKIATVVTHLEMTELPALPSDPHGTWSLRRVEAPGLDWYRDLFRRVGEEWLWISRSRMFDAKLAAIIHSPARSTLLVRGFWSLLIISTVTSGSPRKARASSGVHSASILTFIVALQPVELSS